MIASRTMARSPQVILRREGGEMLQTTRLMASRAGIPPSAFLSGCVAGRIDLGWHLEADEVLAWYLNEGGLRAVQERGRGGENNGCTAD